jgi:hypothetical protein
MIETIFSFIMSKHPKMIDAGSGPAVSMNIPLLFIDLANLLPSWKPPRPPRKQKPRKRKKTPLPKQQPFNQLLPINRSSAESNESIRKQSMRNPRPASNSRGQASSTPVTITKQKQRKGREVKPHRQKGRTGARSSEEQGGSLYLRR